MRIIYNEFTKEILTVIAEDSGTVTALPPGTGVIQGSPQTLYLQALAIGLDASQIPGAPSMGSNILNDRERLIARLARCNNVKLRFLEENLSIAVSAEQSGQLLQAFVNVMLLLDSGDARTALMIVDQLPAALFYPCKIQGSTSLYETPEARKESYVIELQNIVNDLFE